MQVTSSEKLIELCRATQEEAKLLEVRKGDYLMFVRSTAYDQENEPLYAGIQIINGDRFSLYVYETNGEHSPFRKRPLFSQSDLWKQWSFLMKILMGLWAVKR